MVDYRVEVLDSWVQDAPSVRGLAALLGMKPPFKIRALLDRLRQVESVIVEKDINTDDDTPINGHVRFELRSDGGYVFSGHMRATGGTSYHYAVQAWVTTTSDSVIAGQETGRVFGTDTPGPRQRNWHEPGNNGGIKLNWAALRASHGIGYRLDAELSGVLGGARDVLVFALEGIAANLVLGPAGWIVLVGSQLADMHIRIGTPDILAAIAVAGGTLLIIGPFGVIPAAVAGAVAADLVNVRHRSMTKLERDFADRVFNGQIDYDRVTLTNLSHGGGRKFTIPSIDNSILVNLDDAFDNPMAYQEPAGTGYEEPGSVFIHELTHAWQITNNSFLGMICGMSSNYDYFDASSSRMGDRAWPKRAWNGFNNEQQAHIVDDWYGAYVVGDHATNKYAFDPGGIPVTDLNGPAALGDPAYHFIRDNIRAGVV